MTQNASFYWKPANNSKNKKPVPRGCPGGSWYPFFCGTFFFLIVFLFFSLGKNKKQNKKTQKWVPRATGAGCLSSSRVIGALFEALTRQPLLDFESFVAAWQQATQQTVDFESKRYQQAAAIREKHNVSLSFKPCMFIVFCLFFVLLIVCFLGRTLFVICFFKIILIIFHFPMNEGLSTSQP